MCGIVGLYQPGSESAAVSSTLHAMCSSISHRGPDDEGIFIDGPIGLGMRRLSIIDIDGGHQPIQNETGDVTIVFNGEIYNYVSLRNHLQRRGHRFRTHSDTEVIVHAYEEHGDQCVNELNGIFAFALWDSPQQKLLVARDRMGVKPLYYIQTADGLLLASEIKALLTVPGVSRVLDLEATRLFFRLGFVPPPWTLFRGVRKLPPASRLVLQDERVVEERYWDFDFRGEESSQSFEETCEELRSLLAQVVSDQMISDVPVGAFLSGGVDSSAVVALMRAVAKDVKTFNIGFDQQHVYHDESKYAEAVASVLGTQHQSLVVRPRVVDLMPELIEKLDEPLTDTSFMVTYLVSQLAHEHVKVAMSGVGGDELFGGYRRYFGPTLHGMWAWMPQKWRACLGSKLSQAVRADRGSSWGNLCRYTKAWGRTLHMPPGEQYLEFVSVLAQAEVSTLLNPDVVNGDPARLLIDLYDQAGSCAPLNRLLYVDAKTALPESLLLLTDKMGMATSLEVRVPFLDNRLVDFVCTVQPQYRMRGFTLKRLLKASLKGIVPDLVLQRSKRGFGTPMGAWLRTDLQPMVQDMLSERRLAHTGLFNRQAINGLLRAHYSMTDDYTEAISALLTFELWRERFQVRLP